MNTETEKACWLLTKVDSATRLSLSQLKPEFVS